MAKKEATKEEAEKVTQEQVEQTEPVEETTLNYADFVKPLVSDIRDAVINGTQTEENKDKYTEFDVYNSLALTTTLLASRSIEEDSRQAVNAQSIAIANAMVKAGIEQARKDEAFLSAIIIGASRAVTQLNDIIEASVADQEEEK